MMVESLRERIAHTIADAMGDLDNFAVGEPAHPDEWSVETLADAVIAAGLTTPPDRIAVERSLLEDCRDIATPTTSTHEWLSELLGWCDCGYCIHVPKTRPGAGARVLDDPEAENEAAR